MYRFTARATVGNIILVESNTYWSCKAEGNFKLSQYDGFGNCSIKVIIPEDIMQSEGIVYFTYGDDKCEYPVVDVYYTNECFIETIPKFTKCKNGLGVDEKDIIFYYNEPNETFYVSLTCYGGWSASSSTIKFITTNDGIMIISGRDDGTVLISPNNNCGGNNYINIKLIKNLG